MRLHRQEGALLTESTASDSSRIDPRDRSRNPAAAIPFPPYSEMLPRPRKSGPPQSARVVRRETPRPPDIGPGADQMNAICAAADRDDT